MPKRPVGWEGITTARLGRKEIEEFAHRTALTNGCHSQQSTFFTLVQVLKLADNILVDVDAESAAKPRALANPN